ncbi:hypothetical protein jhhlp_007554 [Lomentospora prolificans]|uniref:Uncharacterized protein n=1 Tax=Lomentospora prolificans TaxID=41688 RepID=A0A2N3MZZ1_9PEZI|nr:hypothetical protein jhhlp_007554 [Lomentospora prolificans]
MARVLRTFGKIVAELICHDQSRQVSDINSVSQQEFEDICSWNKSIVEPIEDSVQGGLERKFTQGLETIAQSLTYADLSTMIQRLAQHLNDLGIGSRKLRPFAFRKVRMAHCRDAERYPRWRHTQAMSQQQDLNKSFICAELR